jgi:transposase
MRDRTVGEALKALVLNGLGFVNHALSRVPRFFQNQPTSRLMAPRVTPARLHEDALGRALETR